MGTGWKLGWHILKWPICFPFPLTDEPSRSGCLCACRFQVVELKPGGKDIPVTTANRIAYIHLVADYRLNKQIRPHCLAFRQGLANVVNLEWLRMFDQQEIQVCVQCVCAERWSVVHKHTHTHPKNIIQTHTHTHQLRLVGWESNLEENALVHHGLSQCLQIFTDINSDTLKKCIIYLKKGFVVSFVSLQHICIMSCLCLLF